MRNVLQPSTYRAYNVHVNVNEISKSVFSLHTRRLKFLGFAKNLAQILQNIYSVIWLLVRYS